MIKMFIGNEEVVSNHEFSIKEEMLSASSTILNNCYPKSWELTKDYVSNFYYPKDYSKYVLASGGFEYGDTEYSILDVSGNQPQFESNVEKEWNSLNIYGKTEQKQTTPNKNLLYINSVSSGSGVTITRYSNSEIVVTGTSTSSGTITIPLNSQQLSNQPYTVSAIVTGTINKEIYIDLNTTYNLNLEIDGSGTFTQTSATETASNIVTEMVLTFNNSTTFNNVHIKLQLEQSSTATSYIESQLPMPSPNYPSKLNSVGYENLLYTPDYSGTDRGITTTIQNGIINCVGTTTASYYNLCGLTYISLPIGTYTLNIDKPLTHGLKIRFRGVNISSETFVIPVGSKSVTFTTTDEKIQYYLFAENGLTTGTQINETIYLQLQEGTQAHTYIPYGKYGIEVKTIGKNLFDLSSLTSKTQNGITFTKNDDGTITINGTATATAYYNFPFLYLKSGNYYLSGNTRTNYQNGITMVANYGRYYTDAGNGVAMNITNVNTPTEFYIRVNPGNVINNAILKPMITLGENVDIDYEPYKGNTQLYTLDEPLRSIGDTKDLLYIKNGMLYVERKIGYVVLDGTENWEDRPNYTYADRFVYNSLLVFNSNSGYSNYFKVKSHQINDYPYLYLNNGQFGINFSQKGTTTLADFKTWLSTHNTEVQYILVEPYIEELGQVQIPYSFEGINNVLLNIGVVDTIIDIYYYWKNYNVIFAGIVKNSGEISLNPRHPHYCSLQILDYKTFLSESDTLDYVISNKTIREAIEMVVDTVSDYGFSVGTIDISSADDVIGAYSTLNKTAYDVLQYLADISGSRWRARYIDNSSMAIDFYDPDTLPQVDNIEYTQEYWENNNIVDLTFNYGTRDYRNKQIVLSDEVYAGIDYNEIILSNGYNTNFITSQNVGIVKEITVNGVKKDVISQQERELGADADFYYTPGKNIIESSSSYTAGTQIAVIYTPLVKGRQIVFNNDEVGRIATQTDTIGVISRYESRNDVVSSAELEKIGETYIEYKGKAEIILTLTTHNKDLFNIGEVTYFNSLIDELKQKYMVKSKETQYIIESETGAINLFYVYELTSSFNSEKAINYFDNQRNKAQGNIQEGESITRNIDINSSAVIVWGNSSIEETTISVVGDNVLNSVLNSPFIE